MCACLGGGGGGGGTGSGKVWVQSSGSDITIILRFNYTKDVAEFVHLYSFFLYFFHESFSFMSEIHQQILVVV